MTEILALICLIYIPIIIGLYVFLTSKVYHYARRLKRSGFMWVFASIFITPLLAVIFLHCIGEQGIDE